MSTARFTLSAVALLAALVSDTLAVAGLIVTASTDSRAPRPGDPRLVAHSYEQDPSGTTSLRFDSARVVDENKYPPSSPTVFAGYPRKQPQRDRDLGQTFVTGARGGRLDAIHLRLGSSARAVLAGAHGARVALQLFAVTGAPRLNDHGTPGFSGRFDRATAPELDDFLEGERFRSLRVIHGRLPNRLERGDHLTFDLTGADEVTLAPRSGYAFLLMFTEPGAARAMALANAYYGTYKPEAASPHVGHGLRREGDPALPRGLHAHLGPPPGTLGFPDVCTYRDLYFAVTIHGAPPSAGLGSDLRGAIDLHTHSAPDVMARAIDDLEVARQARAAGLRAVVLKNHVAPTAARAEVAARVVPGVGVFGGVVLNQAVGGLNAEAVSAALRFEGRRGRVVWLPTMDAGSKVVVVAGGRIVPALAPVLRLVAEHDLLLATGHARPAEALVILDAARAAGVRKLLVTHALSASVRASVSECKALVARGALIELAYLPLLTEKDAPDLAAHALLIKEVGARHFVLSSDLGRAGLPLPVDGLRAFAEGLAAEGVSADELDQMLRLNPARLLGLEP